MALSYFTESEAPRDFRVSSTESDGHYKKCLLCYTVKRNFYCPECIGAGNFVHSSMPYSDRFSEKQVKLLRLKANRRHVLDRCDKLLSPKIKRDTLITETKQSRDKIDLLRLAIEQRKNNIDEKKKQLTELVQQNNELRLKLPRYQKRVSSLGKHVQQQRVELQGRVSTYSDQAQALAALRRSRIRQLTNDSIEDMEFVGDDIEEEPPKRSQLHIVAPWLHTDGDFSHVHAWATQNAEAALSAAPPHNPLHRTQAALGLAAQLVALLAATLDVRLPATVPLAEYSNWRVGSATLSRRARRLALCTRALCARSGLAPGRGRERGPGRAPSVLPLPLDALCLAAAADTDSLGRVEGWMAGPLAGAWAGVEEAQGDADDVALGEDDAEPEHLYWPEEIEMDELSSSPPAAAPAPASLVTSTVASIASMWRGWTK